MSGDEAVRVVEDIVRREPWFDGIAVCEPGVVCHRPAVPDIGENMYLEGYVVRWERSAETADMSCGSHTGVASVLRTIFALAPSPTKVVIFPVWERVEVQEVEVPITDVTDDTAVVSREAPV
tara:strand:+ start:917 stop:1282 length:366 start_codon:yes stop_codon:yes gene_type:complete